MNRTAFITNTNEAPAMGNQYIEWRLERWGAWRRSADNLGLGYPANPIKRLMEYGQSIHTNNNTLEDRQAEEIEVIVVQLSHFRPRAAEALRLRYTHIDLTAEDVARRARVGLPSFKRYLEQGRLYLAGALNSADDY